MPLTHNVHHGFCPSLQFSPNVSPLLDTSRVGTVRHFLQTADLLLCSQRHYHVYSCFGPSLQIIHYTRVSRDEFCARVLVKTVPGVGGTEFRTVRCLRPALALDYTASSSLWPLFSILSPPEDLQQNFRFQAVFRCFRCRLANGPHRVPRFPTCCACLRACLCVCVCAAETVVC